MERFKLKDFVSVLMGIGGLTAPMTVKILEGCEDAPALFEVNNVWQWMGGPEAFPDRPTKDGDRYATLFRWYLTAPGSEVQTIVATWLGVPEVVLELRSARRLMRALAVCTGTAEQQPYLRLVEEMGDLATAYHRVRPDSILGGYWDKVQEGAIPVPRSKEEFQAQIVMFFADWVRWWVRPPWPKNAIDRMEAAIDRLPDAIDREALRRYYGLGRERQTAPEIQKELHGQLRFKAPRQIDKARDALREDPDVGNLRKSYRALLYDLPPTPAPVVPDEKPEIPVLIGEALIEALLRPVDTMDIRSQAVDQLHNGGAQQVWQILERSQSDWRNSKKVRNGLSPKNHEWVMGYLLRTWGFRCGMPLPPGDYPWNKSGVR